MIKRWTGRKGEGGSKLKVNRLTRPVEWRMGRDQDERASGLAGWLVVVVGCWGSWDSRASVCRNVLEQTHYLIIFFGEWEEEESGGWSTGEMPRCN